MVLGLVTNQILKLGNYCSVIDQFIYDKVSEIMKEQYERIDGADYDFEEYIKKLTQSGEIEYVSDLEKFISLGLDFIPIVDETIKIVSEREVCPSCDNVISRRIR